MKISENGGGFAWRSFIHRMMLPLFLILIGAVLSVFSLKTKQFVTSYSRQIIKACYAPVDLEISNKAYGIAGDLESNEEKCKAICLWIMSNIYSTENDLGYGPHYAQLTFAKRQGLCGNRSYLMKDMCSRFGIVCRVRRDMDAGHVMCECKYGNKWHLFDPTWAGWVERKGRIISYDELISLNSEGQKEAVSRILEGWKQYISRGMVNNK